jgi:Ca2+-transporting ATPase
MVTGDHPITAGAIARDVGIGGARPNTIEGDELESIIARDGSRALLQVDVVARAVPAQKLLLVRTLQSQREIVAVTGDGVNDVPALQAADIGIAMGERGTTSAREVGAIVLLDDNFRTIVSAIREGRQLFRNLRLSFAYLLMIHIPLVATATMIPLGGYPLLYLPIHIVWLELIIHPTALLAFQELATGSRLAPARRSERAGQFFSKREWLVVGTVGGVVTLAILWAYDRSLVSGGPEHARALALAVLVSAGAAITAGLSGLRTRAATVMSAISVVSAIIFVQLPIIAGPLHLEALQINDWAIAAVGGLVPGALAALFRWGGSTFEPITNTPGSSG